MENKPSFKQAEQRDMYNIEHGDIVVHYDQASKSWKRGIVYNKVAHPRRPDELIGFILLPVETVGRGKKPASPYDTLEKDNGTIVSKAGGTPGKHKTIVYFNLLTVYNADTVMGENNKPVDLTGKEKAWVMPDSDYAGSNYLPEILHRVRDLYNQGRLYKNGEKVVPGGTLRILDPRFAEERTMGDRFTRLRTLARVRQENENGGGGTLRDVATVKPVKKPATGKPDTTPKTAPIPPVAEHFEAARKYDVPLKELFVLVNMGGERNGIARLLGGLPDEIKENDGIQSMVDPSKDRTKITLRDAVTFIEAKGPVSELTKALQTAGSISEASVQKAAARLTELRDALDNVQMVDGKPTSGNPIVDRLINDEKLIVTGP